MNDSMVLRFFNVAIGKTKSRTLSWSRLPLSTYRSLADQDIDEERSFLALYGSGEILLLRSISDDCVYCLIKPEKGLSYQQFGEDNDPTLLRLYNIVYSQFPSVESFVDQFIQDE